MEKRFDADNEPLAALLKDAADGELQLPDFQRGWVWDDAHIRSLLASISLSYPIGAVMTLSTGNPDVRFYCRPLEGVNAGESVRATKLLLDGQQRLVPPRKRPVAELDQRLTDELVARSAVDQHEVHRLVAGQEAANLVQGVLSARL